MKPLTIESILHRLRAEPGPAGARAARVLAEPETYRFQAMLDVRTPCLRETSGFRVGAEYFYPASTVKVLIAAAALAMLDRLEPPSAPVGDAPATTARFAFRDDSGSFAPERSFNEELALCLIVSDNEASNRLLELVGLDGMRTYLDQIGLYQARVVHHLSSTRTPDEQRRSRAVRLTIGSRTHELPGRVAAPVSPPLESDTPPRIDVGIAHSREGETIPGPMSFRAKNLVPLDSLHAFLRALGSPDSGDAKPRVLPPTRDSVASSGSNLSLGSGCGPRLDLSAPHRALLVELLSSTPEAWSRSRGFRPEVADGEQYSDHRFRPIATGLARATFSHGPDDPWIVASKIGTAYGFVTDVAYAIHRPSGTTLTLSMTMESNPSGMVGAGGYDEAFALAFFSDVAQAVARDVLKEAEARLRAAAVGLRSSPDPR
ncbi:MAG: serine hydrolase [Planctomycetota bacterium]|nr:serine hydrolase [Planctomycetota bacterium]